MLSLNGDLTSTRDLRIYPDSTSLGRLAYADRRFLLGVPFCFSSRRRHTRFTCDWSSDVCSSDLPPDHSSRAWWMSEWHTPQNRITSTTSRGPGSRRSMVIGASGLPAAEAPQARIFCISVAPAYIGFIERGRG